MILEGKRVMVPQFVTHYFTPERSPFASLSTVSTEDLESVVEELVTLKANGAHRRVFGRRYMDLRRATEARLLELFMASGGRPARAHPHYFVLGECPWFRELAEDMQTVTVPLSDLPHDQTSFTYPDSMTAMGLGASYGLPHDPKPYHERVYRLHELNEMVARYGLPDGSIDADYEGYAKRSFEKYIEVQLWSDGPIVDHLINPAGST